MCDSTFVQFGGGVEAELRLVTGLDGEPKVIGRCWLAEDGADVVLEEEVTFESGWCDCRLEELSDEQLREGYCETPF